MDWSDASKPSDCQHDLQDGDVTDADGIYHRVLNAVIETAEGEDCSGVMTVSENSINLAGAGNLASARIALSHIRP